MILPLELLVEVFKYNDDDYKTLYSSILVNKQWHNINIPMLWKDPFYSENSIKIIINCILEEDKNFLTRNNIELTFELLDKPPLHNYARFSTKLSFACGYYSLLTEASHQYYDILQDRLANFILDNLSIIRELHVIDMDSYLVNNYHRFDNSFQNLNKLVCCDNDSPEFIDKLANICKYIQSLEIYNSSGYGKNNFRNSLAQLIKAQNQIKQLTIHACSNQALSDNLKNAILTQSQSIIYYSSRGLNNIDYILLPAFKNLKTLSLSTVPSNYADIRTMIKCLKNISLSNIESVKLSINEQPFLSDLSDFININGKTLKYLDIHGHPIDSEFLRRLFQSIAQYCKNLVDLSILYDYEVNQELTGVFNNCIKLEHIEFTSEYALNDNKILSVLNQTLPKKLKSIRFPCKFSTIDVDSFDDLMKNWKGPKPFTIKFNDCQKLVD